MLLHIFSDNTCSPPIVVVKLLLQAARRPSQKLHERNRQGRNHANLFGNALLRDSTHYHGASPPGVSRQSQTRTAAAPGNRAADRLSTASFQYIGASTKGGASQTEPLKKHYFFENRLDIRSMPAIVSMNIYTYHINPNSPIPRE